MKNPAKSTTSKTFLAILLSFTFPLFPRMLISSAQPAADTLKLRSESQLRTEASLYDTAIREISRVATMRPDTVENLKAANTILDKQFRNLKYNRSKLAVMGFNDTTFLNAVKERMRDSNTINAFVLELVQDPNSILKLSGAASLGDRIARSVETDAALLRRVAERIKKASEDIRARTKQHHATNREGLQVDPNLRRGGVGSTFMQNSKGLEAVILVGVVNILFPIAGTTLVGIAAGGFLIAKL